MNSQYVAGSLGDWLVSGSGSVAAQLAVAFARAVEAALLPPGMHLPPERELAASLAVSRSTLRAALEEVRIRGLIESRQGSGTWISPRVAGAERATYTGRAREASAINLANAVPSDAAHLEVCGLSLDFDELLRSVPSDGYAPAGLEALRARCAQYHADHGVPTTAAEIVITSGGQRGMLEALAACAVAGDSVLVAPITYPGALDLLDHLSLVPVAVAADAEGLEPQALERAIRRHRPACAYLAPAVSNPEGQVVAAKRLSELAAVIDRHRLPVVEDNMLAELVYRGQRPPTFANRCRSAPVLSVETVSEIGWGGLRVGWVCGPVEYTERISHRIGLTDLGTSVPSQLLAEQLLDALPQFVPARRRQVIARSRYVRRSLEHALPDWTVVAPAGGLSLWLQLPVEDSAPFAARAREHGVEVMPGAFAIPGRRRSNHVRICIDRPPPIIDEAVARLAGAWDELGARTHAPRRARAARRRPTDA